MLEFIRQPSGLYLAEPPADARVAFLFQDRRTDPTFKLTADSWLDLNSNGFIAFFAQSKTRDWNAFAAGIRSAFLNNAGTQIGWFPEPLTTNQPTLVGVSRPGTPTVSDSFSLVFRNVTFQVQPDLFGLSTTVLFDDASNSIQIGNAQQLDSVFLLSAKQPEGSTLTYQSTAPFTALAMRGPLAGTASVAFQLTVANLAQFEAGVMYFSPPVDGGLVGALSYPVFRPPAGSNNPFNFNITLDVLAPLDPTRTFFQFTDSVLGSNFVTAHGKSFAFKTVDGGGLAASRLVFAGRPSPTEEKFYYLTPAGKFGLKLDGETDARTSSAPESALMLCGITGTEFLSVQLGATPDSLEFVSDQPAYRIPPATDSQSHPVYLDSTATTSYGRIVSANGVYVSQPQRAPLYKQPGTKAAMLKGAAPPSGLSVHILDYFPVDSWTAAQSAAPPTPLAPYAGIAFATNPNLKLAPYLNMESTALNPKRADAYVSAPKTKTSLVRPNAADVPIKAMTPQGMLVELCGAPPVWNGLEMAISDAGLLRMKDMGPSIRKAVQLNQIFVVISTNPNTTKDPIDPKQNLFNFADSDLTIGDWTFNLSPGGLGAPTTPPTPPIFMMKFYPDETIEGLVNDTRLWSQPETFNTTFSAKQAQTYLQKVIADAKEAVFHDGPEKPDKDSLYWNFWQTVTDPAFNGILVVNCNMELNKLPPAIRAVLGGMKDPGIPGFRVHHAGVAINNTSPSQNTPALSRSAMFALVDYEKTAKKSPSPQLAGLDIDYSFEVEYLRALFTNSELRTFSCQIDLTINNLFDTGVNQKSEKKAEAAPGKDASLGGDDANVITIMGSYQAHSTTGDETNSGQGVYSFVAQGDFVFNFTDKDGKSNNKYLKTITLTKLQFSFDQERPCTSPIDGTTTRIKSHFGIWGSLEFNELKVLDIFSFEKLEFSDLGIDVEFNLTIYKAGTGKQPATDHLVLTFAPGNLRLDLGATEERPGENSLLKLIPFKLKSFLYSQYGKETTIESLDYYSLGSVPGLKDNGITLQDKFNYALIFDLDLGSMGGLVGSLSAFKFSMLIGWQSPGKKPGEGGGIAFGVQLPQVDGKLEIKIQGVLTISIQQFNLEYATETDPKMLVLGMRDCYIEVLGQRLPPKGLVSIGLFVPTEGADQIGWIGAYNLGEDGGGGEGEKDKREKPKQLAAPGGKKNGDKNGKGKNGAGSVFELIYVGIGQRVGPNPEDPPKSFGKFLEYMQGEFWDALKEKKYSEIYHPNGKWIIVADFKLLKIIEVGFVFYDVTPFYALQLKITGDGKGAGFEFEITYTKITDTIGLFAATFSLPTSLRTFEVGAASVTLPTLSVGVYTNGNWKVDLGFPDGDNWSVCFQVQAMAGPIPVTGSGGFYIASMSSATDPKVFTGKYDSILKFGFAARLGVGKDFTAGPLKAGVSITFFGIIQGAAGYLTSGGVDIMQRPDALSLQGQFGLIGEIYGSLDFIIIKASVNVRLQASVGIILKLEPASVGAGNGSILLYFEASVSVSVSLEINLGFFSISISFSFEASFRFEWQLVGSSESHHALLFVELTAERRLAAPAPLALLPGLKSDLPLLYLQEATVIFPDATKIGAPWVVVSLGVQYEEDAPKKTPPYADFSPFEAVATQLATFALMHAMKLPSYDSEVLLETDPVTKVPGLKDIDSEPELLTGWIDYPALLSQLANFKATVEPATGNTKACGFPMPPFLNLATSGRTVDGSPADLNYQFESKNVVPLSYLKQVDDYFNQLFVNQTQGDPSPRMLAETLMPLAQEIFLDYFKGLIRGTVHQLLVVMQNAGQTKAKLTDLFSAVAGLPASGTQTLFQQLAGQMTSALRGGVRLPYTAGLTVPGGAASTTTNAMFALLWQEFPVGGFAKDNSYKITLTNPDKSQTWLTANASFSLTSAAIEPYSKLTESSVTKPGTPTPISLTSTGPQAFAFESAIVWTPPTGPALSLRPFPSSLARLQTAEGTAAIDVLVKSREAHRAYLPDGTPLPAANVAFASSISLTVKQVPGEKPGTFLPDVFALSGASQAEEALLGRILADLRAGDRPITAIQILYQTAADAPGLVSAAVDAKAVFVLRTNTTSVSQPPPGLTSMAMAVPLPQGVAVGASSEIGDDGGYSFIQIVQQATVTNAAGYYLRFIDKAGHSLPDKLFVKGVGQVTLLVSYKPGGGNNKLGSPLAIEPYHNAAVLTGTTTNLVYYAETTDPALAIRYIQVAPGTFGVTLSRNDKSMRLKAPAALAATAKLSATADHTRGDAIKALRAAGITGEEDLHRSLAAMGGAPAALNSLYALVAFQVQKTAGFHDSNLSAPLQPQRPDKADKNNSYYRVFAPLYNLANDNYGSSSTPNRYASINAPFTLSFFTNDAFGNQLPTPSTYSGTNLYFDPIVPLDQWMGVVPSFDFGDPKPNVINIRLTPSKSTFDGMSLDQRNAALVNFRTIQNQIMGTGVSFYVETSLALQADGSSLVQFPVNPADTKKVTDMVTAIVTWLAKPDSNFPGAVTISMAVSGPGTLPPLFEIAVLFGIMRDPALISPYLKDKDGMIIFPSAQNVAATIVPETGGANNMPAFAADFVKAFPAQKLAVGMNGTHDAPARHMSSTARLRKNLKALKLANDGSGGARAGAHSIWAAAASLLDISIGIGNRAGPRFLSPKPLDNALNSATVRLPKMSSTLPSLPAQRLFVDIDLDQLNRAFFQTVDDVLGPAFAAQAFEVAGSSYDAIARGRETLAQEYSQYEVDWLFSSQSPFTGTHDQLTIAREVFEQQMRAALMTAYSVDTVVQYDVTWNKPVSPAANNYIELFGQIEAMLRGTYSWVGNTLTATTASANALTSSDRVLMVFSAVSGQQPPNGVYTVTVVDATHFTIAVSGGSGNGTFVGTRQNAGLSTAHVAIVSAGSSPLTFLYGDPDVASRATVPFDLRYNVTNLQYFLAPPGAPGEARPSIWLQLIDPYPQGVPHVGPAGALTTIPVVFRQYPTPPTLVSQSWDTFKPTQPSGNPLADGADWKYLFTYQAFLAAQDQINTDVTYNTDLSTAPNNPAHLAAAALDDGPYDLFTALARTSAVTEAIRPILQTLESPSWSDAIAAFAKCVVEVTKNKDWNKTAAFAMAGSLVNVTDSYVVTDTLDDDRTTQQVRWQWPTAQGESTFANVTLALTALDPSNGLKPYPNQRETERGSNFILYQVDDAPIGGRGVAHLIEVDALNVLAAENALAAVQVERNLITLRAPDGTPWQVVSEFVYMTPQVRPSQPVTPFIDNATAIDVAKLPSHGLGEACPPSPSSLCQRIYTLMADLLADPVQANSLLAAHRTAGVTSGTKRRVKVGCSYRFPIPSAAGGRFDDDSITPLVPVVLARTFEIDGHQSAQLGDFSLLFATAVDGWATTNAIPFGPTATPAGAMLVFDITLYAALSGVDTPVLRFSNLQLKLTNIDP